MKTPLLEITSLGFNNGNRVFAKLENHNPISNSHYDRVYEFLFNRFMSEGTIVPGKTHLIETSSGNAGTAFVRFCEKFGFQGTLIFPSNVRPSRVNSSLSKNVNVVISKGDGYMLSAKKDMLRIFLSMKKNGADVFLLNHSQLHESVASLYPCGEEVADSFDTLKLDLDYFITALGNGTSTNGIGTPLKKRYPEMSIIGFEPNIAPVFTNQLNKQTNLNENQASIYTGTGVWGIDFPNMDLSLLSDIVLLPEDSDAIDRVMSIITAVKNKYSESIGFTSAASIIVAQDLSKKVSNKAILTVVYDSGEFYGL